MTTKDYLENVSDNGLFLMAEESMKRIVDHGSYELDEFTLEQMEIIEEAFYLIRERKGLEEKEDFQIGYPADSFELSVSKTLDDLKGKFVNQYRGITKALKKENTDLRSILYDRDEELDRYKKLCSKSMDDKNTLLKENSHLAFQLKEAQERIEQLEKREFLLP